MWWLATAFRYTSLSIATVGGLGYLSWMLRPRYVHVMAEELIEELEEEKRQLQRRIVDIDHHLLGPPGM